MLANDGREFFLKIPVYCGGIRAAKRDLTCTEGSRIMIFASAHVFSLSKSSRAFHDLLLMNGVYPDSFYITRYLKLFNEKVEQVRGQDFLTSIFMDQNLKLNHFLIGEAQLNKKVIEHAAEINESINICGHIDAPFKDEFSEDIERWCRQIEQSKADIVWLGIGTPKQQIIASQIIRFLNCKIVCIGAAMSFFVGELRPCPNWLSRMGAEWLFRFFCEPRRLFSRYLVHNLIFIFMLINDLFSRLVSPNMRNRIPK
jgi:N-acetylglucosaminyldiphosphoundecaprenol N-acetyl-beta-D-mannosaminyltransferase